MKHNIRINGVVKEIDCELGSGILDKHGREIFEGNKVKNPYGIAKAIFTRGMFRIDGYLLDIFPSGVLEIVD